MRARVPARVWRVRSARARTRSGGCARTRLGACGRLCVCVRACMRASVCVRYCASRVPCAFRSVFHYQSRAALHNTSTVLVSLAFLVAVRLVLIASRPPVRCSFRLHRVGVSFFRALRSSQTASAVDILLFARLAISTVSHVLYATKSSSSFPPSTHPLRGNSSSSRK